MNLKIHEKPITIINIYGPNKDELNIFEILEAYIRSNEDKNFINGGDFITVLDIHLDKTNGRIELSKLLTSCLTAVKNHVIRYCEKGYERSGKNLF